MTNNTSVIAKTCPGVMVSCFVKYVRKSQFFNKIVIFRKRITLLTHSKYPQRRSYWRYNNRQCYFGNVYTHTLILNDCLMCGKWSQNFGLAYLTTHPGFAEPWDSVYNTDIFNVKYRQNHKKIMNDRTQNCNTSTSEALFNKDIIYTLEITDNLKDMSWVHLNCFSR